ncbi:MAG TPA: creatininase family protein [Gemmatimonadaceae bacterium]
MVPRPYVLAEATWEDVTAHQFEVAVLPWGATEAHNRHLPYATDNHETEAVAIAAAGVAWNRGARVLVLPTVPFGVNTGQREIPFCLNMMPSTQLALVRDLLPACESRGVRKLVLLNGHGGNDFRAIVRELQPSTSVVLALVNWWQVVSASEYFEEPGDHAGELETSVMLHVRRDLVRPLERAGRGTARPHVVRAFREGWAWMPRPWVQVTDDTGVGDPSRSTVEKGAAFFSAATERIAEFLVDFAQADPARLYDAG